MTDQDWLDLGANHGVDPDRLRDLVAKWAGEKDRRYAAKGWRMAVDRALRDRWAWTSSLFATPNGMIQNNRESAAQARVRRTDEAGDKALALLLGGQAPLLTAIEGGSR